MWCNSHDKFNQHPRYLRDICFLWLHRQGWAKLNYKVTCISYQKKFKMLSSLLRSASSNLLRWNFQTRCLTTISKDTKIGVIGLGNVGSAMTNNLVKHGYPVTGVFDTNSARFDTVPKDVPRAKTPREVTENAEVIISALPRPANVQSAAEGPAGILAALKNKIWIDHSTTDSNKTMEYSEIAKSQGSHVLEAPITGGIEALRKGQMVAFLGGDEEVANAVMPILDPSFIKVLHVGPIGTAMLIKISSNLLVGVHVIAIGEVLLLAKRAGLDLKTFWNAIRMSAGNSFIWETGVPMMFTGSYDPGFPMTLHCKDLNIAYAMGRKYEVPMDMQQLGSSIYYRTMYQLGEMAGCYSPPKTYEMALGESLATKGFENWTYENEIHDGTLVVNHKNLE